jgi:methylmalonyl-CoA mutase cobalamin-binding domain/chain
MVFEFELYPLEVNMNHLAIFNHDSRRRRLLLATDGRKAFDRAECRVACCLRDAGFEVVHIEGPISPRAIACSAIQECVDLICLATASQKKPGFRRNVSEQLIESGADDISVVNYTLRLSGDSESSSFPQNLS